MLEEFPFFLPLTFFEVSFDVKYFKGKKLNRDFLLLSTSKYLDEEEFAKVYFGWNDKGLYFLFEVEGIVEKICYPDFRKGDSIELFIDTRNVKTFGYTTKFCHHFLIFPKKHEGHYAKEITRFREEDMHKIANPKDFEVGVSEGKKRYLLDLFIPSKCLHGYDPSKFDKLGFTYRINRNLKDPQHFSVSSKEYVIEREPAFFATALLKR
jgi:hypothetical protein